MTAYSNLNTKSSEILDSANPQPDLASELANERQANQKQEQKQHREWQGHKHIVRTTAFYLASGTALLIATTIAAAAAYHYLSLMSAAPEEHLQHLWQFLTKFAMGAIAGGAAVIKIYRINIFPKNTAPPSD